jgi:peptidoglycan hydrolase CwlO-like protein
MHILTEWQIRDWINAAVSSKADFHAVHALDGRVDRLEHSLREARAENARLQSQCDELQADIRHVEARLMQNANA